jgi:hypothetical protein
MHREPADEAFAFYDLLDANDFIWVFTPEVAVGCLKHGGQGVEVV